MIIFQKAGLFLALIGLLCGCALLTKTDPLNIRYFSLENVPLPDSRTDSESQVLQKEPVALRLTRVTGARYLEEQLVYRDAAHEVGYYRERRWTEPPENYLERMLARELFERRSVSHIVGGRGPTLDLKLTGLDEIRRPSRFVRVQVIVRLHNEKNVLWEETLTEEVRVDENSTDEEAAAAVAAFAQAMQNVVNRIADSTIAVLAEHAATSPSSPKKNEEKAISGQ